MSYIGYIYITENLINGKKYIGKRQKSKFDASYIGSGMRLKRAINKYGKENFKCTPIKWCKTLDELNESERQYIKEYDAQNSDMFYNISEGGDWGDISQGMTPEEYKRWGDRIRKHHIGTKKSDITKAKISKAHQGKTLSQETRAKLSELNKGKNNPMYGKTHSKETIDKMNQRKFKKTKMILNGQEIIFNSRNECADYLKENYNLSIGTVKTLLKTGEQFNSPYKRFEKLKGLQLIYIDKENL